MVSLAEIITLTPLVQALFVYIVLYRYDLSRVLHPMYERRGDREWRRVLTGLGLIIQADEKQEKRKEKEREVAVPVRAVSLGAVVLISTILIDAVITPVLSASLPVFSRIPILSVVTQALLQFIPAFIALIGMARFWLGPIPVPPYKYALPGKRLGSLVRHLEWDEPPEAKEAGDGE
jgi:hypothetical protein